jgi:hypothetical protein
VSYEIRWGGDPEDLLVTYAGPASNAELIASVDEVRASPHYRPGMRVLLDQRAMDWTEMTAADVRRRADAVLASAVANDGHRVATVVDRKLAFGLARMLQALTEDAIAEKLFYDVESARTWLAESPD